MCDRFGDWLFANVELKDRIWEADKIGKKGLLVLRIIGFLILLEINILAIFVYVGVTPLKIFSITAISYIFSLFTYGLLLASWMWGTDGQHLWKIAHSFFEIFFSFTVGLTVVFWCLVVPIIFTKKDFSVNGLQNSYLELAVRIQYHLAVFGLFIADLYVNRIEFPFRHFIIVVSAVFIFIALYLGISKMDKPIDDYVDWSDLHSMGFIAAAGALILGAFLIAALISAKKKDRYVTKATMKDVGAKERQSSDRISLDSV